MFLCIIIGLVLMIAVALIPQETIKRNSQAYIEETQTSRREDIYARPRCRSFYTESYMFMLACTMDEKRPLESALESRMYEETREPTVDFNIFLNKGAENMKQIDYNRYWHGYLVLLRPAIALMSSSTLRNLNCIFFYGLTIYLSIIVYHTFGGKVVAAFAASLIYASFWTIPQAFDFITTFLIAFLASIAVIKSNKLCCTSEKTSIFFLIIGALTSYTDFLITPIVTIAYPLIFASLLHKGKPWKQHITFIFICSAAWAIGYVGMWAAKWILCVLFTNCEVYTEVKGRLMNRTYKVIDTTPENVFRYFFWFLPAGNKFWDSIYTVIIILGTMLPLGWICSKYKQFALDNIAILLLMFYPAGWFLMAFGHSFTHIFFTYRAWGVFVFAYLIFMMKAYETIKPKR